MHYACQAVGCKGTIFQKLSSRKIPNIITLSEKMNRQSVFNFSQVALVDSGEYPQRYTLNDLLEPVETNNLVAHGSFPLQ